MTVRIPMTFREVEAATVGSAIADPNVIMQQKVDGTRALVVITTPPLGETFVRFLARNGQQLKHSAAAQHFEAIATALKPHFPRQGETVLDGEIMWEKGELVMFDLPYEEIEGIEIVTPAMPLSDRLQFLGALAHAMSWDHRTEGRVRVVASAFTEATKRDLWERVRTTGGEGVMVKDRTSAYEPGKRVKHSVKVKLIKTADVVVMGSTRGRNAAGRETGGFTFGVYVPCTACEGTGWEDTGDPLDEMTCVWCTGTGRILSTLGSCSAIGKPHTEVGDVIEVAYLSWVPGGAPVQPRMVRTRPDKDPEECTLDQLVAYSRAVL